MKLPEDPFVRELLPEFVETWIEELDNFNEYYTKDQPDELYRMAHTLKGSCYQFGLNDLGDMGIELMTYAKQTEWHEAGILHNKIKTRFIEINEYLITNNLV